MLGRKKDTDAAGVESRRMERTHNLIEASVHWENSIGRPLPYLRLHSMPPHMGALSEQDRAVRVGMVCSQQLHHDCQNNWYRVSSRYVRNISAAVYLLRLGSKVCRYCGKPCSESFSCEAVEISLPNVSRYQNQSSFSFCNVVTMQLFDLARRLHFWGNTSCENFFQEEFYEELLHS
jgi:hypothetical protein